MKAKDFDKRFDKGEDVTRFLDRSKARRPAQEQRRVNVDFPLWMVHSLDREAKRLGVTRQSVIKLHVLESRELRGRRAVATPSDEGIEPSDEGPDPVGHDPLAFHDSAKNLLNFEVLLADAHVELGEALFIDAVLRPEQAYHLLARLSRGKRLETRDQRDLEVGNCALQVGEAVPDFALQVGEAAPELALQVGEAVPELALQVGEAVPDLLLEVREPRLQVLVDRIQGHLVRPAAAHA